MDTQQYDVLIIGAGISGIGMACHLARECPNKRYAILERRQAIGGTWDLFRYPGIRSDSDMMSFGYKFRPWTDTRILAEGPSIRRYVNETALEFGVDKNVQFGLKITKADWSSKDQHWSVYAQDEKSGEVRIFKSRYLVTATGYYNYDQGYMPDFPGLENFNGRCIHPQFWPEDLNYKNKRVIVIGSGATAVTLIPSMANNTAHITMLQRSPSYMYSIPAVDKVAALLTHVLPESWVYKLARLRNISFHRTTYKLFRRFPKQARAFLLANVRKQIGPTIDMKHFTPKYMPWDERLCAVQNGDLFKVLREGKASIVTDHIDRFTEKGILLKSGQELEADIVVAATGLQVQMLGGMELSVDGKVQNISERMSYKAVLMDGIPNMAFMFGYTNISWTLKIDMAADYVCRLLKEMDRRCANVVVPRAPKGEQLDESILASLQAGYVQRGNTQLPRQGREQPWRVLHHLEMDSRMLKKPIDDGVLQWLGA